MMHRWVLRHLAAFAAAIVPLCAALAADAAPDYDVIVAGGGPAGIGAGAAAAEAVKQGIDLRAVDARNLRLFDGAAEQKQVKDK